MSQQPTREQVAARMEDVRWMAETGENLDGAARRLGLQPKSLERFLERAGADDLLAALVSRQPRDHNRVAPGEAAFTPRHKRNRQQKRRSRERQRQQEGMAA